MLGNAASAFRVVLNSRKTCNAAHYNPVTHPGINKTKAGINKRDCVNPITQLRPLTLALCRTNPHCIFIPYLITGEIN